jgi:translation initiation factor IF-2
MSDVTVKQLAETVGAPIDRLLKQMQEAGLPHQKEEEVVSDDEKQELLAFLKRSHGENEGPPRRITMRRTSQMTLKAGQGRSSRAVQVQRKRQRTYAKAGEVEPGRVTPQDDATSEAKNTSLEAEAEGIRQEELARKSTEEEAHRQAAEKKEKEEKREEEARKKQEEEARKKQEEEALKVSQKPQELDEAAVAEAAAKAQAEAQAQERASKRTKNRTARGREQPERTDDLGGNKSKRHELSLKRESRRSRRRPAATVSVEIKGGKFERPTDFIQHTVDVGEVVQVGELAQRMSVKAGEVIKTLMGMGVMATINQTLDQDTATLVVEEMGHVVSFVAENEIEQQLEESLKIEGESELRSPVVTVMGHVDHGKTSLLDYVRNTHVVAGEAGGITQHIGAYQVDTEHGKISFLDTPGHAAFTAMRARGAKATDIVILVVAGDDGVMPQTEEAVQHAKAAEVPIVVAINKMDLDGADSERIKNELSALEVIPEQWGGDTQFVEVSAETGQGVGELLEAINLQAELLELQAVPDAQGRGVVVESRLDRWRGPVATLLVQNGTLRLGDVVIAGEHHGRVRVLANERGEPVDEAGPSVPVEILGLNGTPNAGDDFSVVTDGRRARELSEFREEKSQERRVAIQKASKLENMFADIGKGEKRVMKIVLKTDVRGSLEAIAQACADIGNEEVAVNVMGSGVGAITESDAMLAVTYGAAIFGFNVRADKQANSIIEREGMDLRYYSVIYELLDDIKMVLEGMLSPEIREEIVGTAEVRDVFRSPRFGQVAGCMVVDGTVHRNKEIRVLRDNVVIFEGELESLRRFKEDVNEVRNGLECGIGVRNYNDVRIGDKIEVFDSKEFARAL